MRRRDFLKSGLLLLPALPGCVAPGQYPMSHYGKVRGLEVAVPTEEELMFLAYISRSVNIYSAAGENASIAERLRKGLFSRTRSFHAEMRKELIPALAKHRLEPAEVRRPADDIGSGRPQAALPLLDIKAYLYFVAAGDGIAPGAMTECELETTDGRRNYTRRILMGPRISMLFGTNVDGPRERFRDVPDILANPEPVSATLMRLAGPLGALTAAIVAKDLAGAA